MCWALGTGLLTGAGAKVDVWLAHPHYSLPGQGDAKNVSDLFEAPVLKGSFNNDLTNKYMIRYLVCKI